MPSLHKIYKNYKARDRLNNKGKFIPLRKLMFYTKLFSLLSDSTKILRIN